MIVRLLVSLCVTGCLIGCSSAPEKPDPTRLKRISSQFALIEQGSASLGGRDLTGLIPAFTESGVVAVSSNGTLARLTAPSLDEVWEVDINQEITAGVGANKSSAFVVTGDARLLGFSLDTGALEFERRLPGSVTAPPIVDGERVFVKTQTGRLLAISTTTGETLWVEEGQESNIGIRGSSPMTLVDDVVWVLWESGRLVGYQATTGRIVLERQVAVASGRSPLERMVDAKGAPSIQNGLVAVATRNGQLSVLDVSSGQFMWSLDLDAYPGAVIGFNAVTVVETDGTVSAYSLSSGESLWSNSALRYRELSAPAIFANTIAVVDLEGVLHLLDPTDGLIIARKDLGSAKGLTAPVPVDNGLVVQLVDGRLKWVDIKR